MSSDLVMVGIAAAVLLSYWYSHLARRYHFPSVMLLVATGVAARVTTHAYQASVSLPPQVLPVLGTIGLVLIVLEGALDLRLDTGRRAFLWRTLSSAALGVAATTLALAIAAHAVFGLPWHYALLGAAPFGVISSAVAIPSAEHLPADEREFVIYESSWSDIVGVMLFNALLVGSAGGAVGLNLIGGGLALVVVGLAMSLAVVWLVSHLEGQVKFLPLLFALMLVYAGADALHLSPLLIVLILGLVLNNPQLLQRFPMLRRLHSDHYDAELGRLKHLTSEATFLVRTFFFLLLGYVTPVNAFADPLAWLAATAIVIVVFTLRWAVLRAVHGRRVRPLLWLAPRGLITATLFFSTPAAAIPAAFPPAALILVVLLSGFVMALGLKFDRQRVPAAAPQAA